MGYHTTRWAIRALLAAIVVAGTMIPLSRAAQPDLSSPRATFDTFLTSMALARDGDDAAFETAVSCLDLGGLAPAVRAESGPGLARDLKTFLDKTVFVDLDSLPSEYAGDEYVFLRTPAGSVVLDRQEDGRWLFSPLTIESLPTLLDTVRDKEFVAGLEGGGSRATFADWLRGRMPETLKKRLFILEVWQWLALILVAFVGVVVDRLVRVVLGAWIQRLVRKAERFVKTEELNFTQPIGILAGALTWSLLLRPLDLPAGALGVLVLAARVVMAAAGVWAAYRLVDLVTAYLSQKASRTETHLDDLLVPLIRRGLKVLVVAFGLVFIAQNLDVDVSSLLAGLGIGGLAFALAAKDTVENLFGSVTVLLDQPFVIGDWVVIGDLEGTVEEVGMRSTRIRTFYNSVITVPNSKLVRSSVDNLGARRFRRLSCKLGVQYDTDPGKIDAFCEGIRELIRRHPYTRTDYYMVYLNEFADSSLNILLYVFWETPDWATELRERHRLLVDIVRLAKRLGVEFAFPTRTLHVASVPAGVSMAPAEEPIAVSREPAPDPGTVPRTWNSADHERALILGREEAEAIVAGMWGEGRQEPVNFGQPVSIRPDAPDS